MSPPRPEIISLLTRFGIASDLFRNQMERRLVPWGLTPAQLSVLAHLVRKGVPQRVTDVARAVEVGQPAVTKMMTKFENAGWITVNSDKSDKRSRMAQATDAGRMRLQEVQRSLMPSLGPFLAQWSAQDLELFESYLTRLSQHLDCNR